MLGGLSVGNVGNGTKCFYWLGRGSEVELMRVVSVISLCLCPGDPIFHVDQADSPRSPRLCTWQSGGHLRAGHAVHIHKITS